MTVLWIVVIAAALLGAPLFAVLAAVAMLGFQSLETDLAVMGVNIYRLIDTPTLIALPLFTFAGYLLAESGTSRRIVHLTQAGLGWLPGGLAVVALTACALFTPFTGASGITIVALGALLYPALLQGGYRERFSLGLVTTSGSLGLLLPPSLPLILFAIIAQQLPQGAGITIQQVFLAGVLPGLFMLLVLCLYSWWSTRRDPVPLTLFSGRELARAAWAAKWELPLPFFVFGGIYGGFFAVNEAAAVTALYVLIVEVFIYREIALRQVPRLMREAMIMVGGVLIILGVALALTDWLIQAEVPTRLLDFAQQHIQSKFTFLLLLNALLLVLGCLLDIFSAIVIMVPLLLPIAVGYGVDPLHLGIIFLANLEIGYLTPPVGMNLFIASYRFRKPITELYRATLPYILVLLAVVLVITYWPGLTLALVR